MATKTNSETREFKDGIRVSRLQIGDIEGGAETIREWKNICEVVRDITNTIHNQWIVWHEKHEHFQTAKAFHSALMHWHKADKGTRGPKPKSPIKCWTNEMRSQIRRVCIDRFPSVNIRLIELLMQRVGKALETRKPANRNFYGWMEILLGKQALPSSTKYLPIPIDNKNCNVKYWYEQDGEWRISPQLTAIGQGVGKKNKNPKREVTLRTNSKRAWSQRLVLERIVDGEYAFKGSQIEYREHDRKWYLLLAYQVPKEVSSDLDRGKTAVLKPAKTHPWLIKSGRQENWLVGAGKAVPAMRRQLFRQRVERLTGYRVAGSANKGHGRRRALYPVRRLRHGWKDFVQTLNHTSTARAVKFCLEHGIGRLVYHQPVGDERLDTYLGSAGRRPESKASVWDWYQVATQLAYKCQAHGIEFVIVKKKEDGDESAVAA